MSASIVRIKKFKEDHPNAYARVDTYSRTTGIVQVSNMNMPYRGTFSGEPFKFYEVDFIQVDFIQDGA